MSGKEVVLRVRAQQVVPVSSRVRTKVCGEHWTKSIGQRGVI